MAAGAGMPHWSLGPRVAFAAKFHVGFSWILWILRVIAGVPAKRIVAKVSIAPARIAEDGRRRVVEQVERFALVWNGATPAFPVSA